MNYLKMFNNMHPGFFDDPGIKGMPKNWLFSELIMDLRNDSPREVVPPCPENIIFCEYKGDIDKLKKAVSEVDENWVHYFGEWSRVFCAFDRDEVVAFCILSDFGTQDNLNIGGPGCVGTIPKYRGKGIGLELVKRATDLLKKEKYDISWIHYTHLENWYKKLGYETVLKWNSDGIVMEKVIDKDFRGNAYIIKNKEVLLKYSGGFADLANEIPNTIDTRFASASMSKTFVAVGILQLIEEEKLGFEDTIGAILDFDLRQIDPDVTVRQLLNHTSGVPDYYDESVMDDYEALWTDYPNYRIRHNLDMLPLFIDKPMMYDRGEKFQYNNSGYVLLAMIIEKISGVDFDVYLKQNVFDRCAMSNTGYYSFDKLPAKCANSYIYCPDTDDYRTNIYSVGAKGTGDGGAFVTVEDIVKFWDGLLEHKLLSEKTVNQMFSKQSGDGKDPEEGYYGFGVWIIDNPKGQDYVYMQGCDDGVSAISEYNPNNGMITVMLSNYGDNVWARMRKIRKEMY